MRLHERVAKGGAATVNGDECRSWAFESPETRAAFAANPQRYTSRVLLAEQPSQSGGTVLR